MKAVFIALLLVAGETAALAGAQSQKGAPAVSLATLLERAAAYVDRFTDAFINVVAEERYIQQVTGRSTVSGTPGRGATAAAFSVFERRELLSDFLLVKLAGVDSWVQFRDVFQVDGRPVREREARLARLVLNPTQAAVAQAQQILEDSTRYNIGDVQRTINMPLLTQGFLDARQQTRFRFSLSKEDPSVGAGVWAVDYEERQHPTVVRTLDGRDLYSSGRMWIEAATGRVVRTEIVLQDKGLRATVTTSFRPDERFRLDVPFEMVEEYTLANRSRITGRASYGRFRRFDVTATEKMPDTPSNWLTDTETGMILIELPRGRFAMGSPEGEAGRNRDEQLHDVTIAAPVYLGRFEVTQQEWREVMGGGPSRFSACGARCPVENVTYDDVQKFLAKLNRRSTDLRFRLPTEAEWEYACRAGTASPYSTGAGITPAQANVGGVATTMVGTFDANPWGFGDMHGNVSELTADWYGAYAEGEASDPRGPDRGDRRVLRGGNWNSGPDAARCAVRHNARPDQRSANVGFRVAAELVER